jgi:hypothetical protein
MNLWNTSEKKKGHYDSEHTFGEQDMIPGKPKKQGLRIEAVKVSKNTLSNLDGIPSGSITAPCLLTDGVQQLCSTAAFYYINTSNTAVFDPYLTVPVKTKGILDISNWPKAWRTLLEIADAEAILKSLEDVVWEKIKGQLYQRGSVAQVHRLLKNQGWSMEPPKNIFVKSQDVPLHLIYRSRGYLLTIGIRATLNDQDRFNILKYIKEDSAAEECFFAPTWRKAASVAAEVVRTIQETEKSATRVF